MKDDRQDPESDGSVAEGFRPPLSTSSPALLDGAGSGAVSRAGGADDAGGGDARFRAMVYDLLALESQMREARDRLAAEMGVSGPGYMILMVVAQAPAGISVGDVARRLHVSGAFVTTEAGKLARVGLVAKRRNPADGRGVLLRPTRAGAARIEAMAPRIRRVNDHFFGELSAADFEALSRIAGRLGRKVAADCFLADEDAA